MSFDRKLKGILKVRYRIKVKTGLHIGGSKESIEIGGIDNVVVKIPRYEINGKELRNVPYIPGSSLKGKVRSLLEWVEIPEDKGKPIALEWGGEPCQCGKCNVCKLFGVHKAKNIEEPEPVRLRFEDFYPTEETINMWERVLEVGFTELKTENIINRIRGNAEHPRHMERVIPGSVFEGYITMRVFEGDGYALFELLDKGLRMLEDDYLGGSGSRGYGRVEIIKPDKVIWKELPEYKEQEIDYAKIEDKVFKK
ncbi:MAG TPA: type III-A CRISPR-associated RAMP protein Csm3 [Aquifex aeolicus]|nr:type III-A CRISPR-associated RAMP protein Csm3 [Aquifex aeolicus]